MGDKSTRLFSEFNDVDSATWLKKIEKDLKGKPLDILNFRPESDLDAKAYYHIEDFSNNYQAQVNSDQDNNDWFITELLHDLDSKMSNAKILKCLNTGTTGLKIEVTDATDFDELFEDVLLEHIFLHLKFTSIDQVKAFSRFIWNKKLGAVNIEMPILTSGLDNGRLDYEKQDLLEFYNTTQNLTGRNLIVDGTSFGNYGASTVQELAVAISQLNEMIQSLSDSGLNISELGKSIAFNLSVNEDYFVNISKFRAIKRLSMELFAQWGIEAEHFPWLNAETGVRNVTKNDRYNNVLRQTTEVMSAVIGGVNTVVAQPYTRITGTEEELSERLSRNLQLILKEESYFNQVVDPGTGSYYIEYLTSQLVEKAWELFMEIEDRGGYYDVLTSGYLHDLIEANKAVLIEQLNDNGRTLLGVNKYPNSMENWIDKTKVPESVMSDFKGFNLFILENQFEKTV